MARARKQRNGGKPSAMQARGAGRSIAGIGASAEGLEGLLAVNQELQGKLVELASTNNDLNNLLASSEITTLCLDRDHRIKWFSPTARDVLGISPSDVGRPVSDLGSPLLGSSLIADAAKVHKSLTPGRTELDSGTGRHYIRRTMPFRLADGRVEGVIVTFDDITESKARADQLLAEQAALSRTLEQRVAERTDQLRTLMFELAMAEERERREIAADLHDHLGQLLAVAGLKLGALTTGDEPASHALREASELILQAKRAVGSLAFQISPPVLFELGLVPALEWLAEEMHRVYGIDVEVRDDGKPKPLDQTVRAIVFRAVRELLINVAKHAKVGRADVDVRRTATELVVSVTDNGVGFEVRTFEKPESGGGFGLPSLRERLGYIGGSLHIDSVPGDGTVATLSAPFEVKPRAPGKVSS